MPIHSLQVEKHAIGGLIKHSFVFADIAPIANENIFYNDVHAVLFSIIRDSMDRSESIDKVLIAKKVKDLGISFKDEIDIYEYVDSICFTEITPEATIEAFKELINLKIRRDIFESAQKIQKEAKTNLSLNIDQLISGCDSIYNSNISSLYTVQDPENLFKNIDLFVEERGNNIIEENGLITPYPEFNRLYGGLRSKNVYAFVARPENGKTTILYDISFKTALLSNFKVKALFLNTEMETEDMRWRAVSAISGVGMWYLETGNWKRNAEMVKKVRDALEVCKKYEYNHLKIGNKTIDQVCSIVKRWYYSKVGRGNPAIIVYDYVKLTGEKVSESHKEYQVIGEKIDKLKKLAEEISAQMLVAMQLNRQGENFNKKSADVVDDSSSISTSDRLQWFASYVGIFRRKVIEEITEDGADFGTHKLISVKTRFQGKDAAGHQNLLRRKFKDGSEKYVMNYLNFDVQNFNVSEKGSLKHIIDANKENFDVKEKNEKDSDTDL